MLKVLCSILENTIENPPNIHPKWSQLQSKIASNWCQHQGRKNIWKSEVRDSIWIIGFGLRGVFSQKKTKQKSLPPSKEIIKFDDFLNRSKMKQKYVLEGSWSLLRWIMMESIWIIYQYNHKKMYCTKSMRIGKEIRWKIYAKPLKTERQIVSSGPQFRQKSMKDRCLSWWLKRERPNHEKVVILPNGLRPLLGPKSEKTTKRNTGRFGTPWGSPWAPKSRSR